MKRIALALLLVLALTTIVGAEPIVINMRVGKDATGANELLVKMFNESRSDIQIDYQEMPPSSSTQRDTYVTILAAKDSALDVFAVDMPWAPEFASAGWLMPLDKFFP